MKALANVMLISGALMFFSGCASTPLVRQAGMQAVAASGYPTPLYQQHHQLQHENQQRAGTPIRDTDSMRPKPAPLSVLTPSANGVYTLAMPRRQRAPVLVAREGQSATLVLRLAPYVYQIQSGAAFVAAAQPLPRGRPAIIELANGCGFPGLARRWAAQFRQTGLTRLRISNQRPFSHVRGHVYYRVGSLETAMAIQAILPGNAVLQVNNQLPRGVSARVILGSDQQQARPQARKLSYR